MASVAYLDSSAIVKTIIREPESAALRRFLRRIPVHASSALARTEVIRAVRRTDATAVPVALEALRRLMILELSEPLLVDAGMLDPPDLRSFDAVHITAAKSLGAELEGLVTYDVRMAAAAVALGLPVARPQS